jgi:hypothetical protein
VKEPIQGLRKKVYQLLNGYVCFEGNIVSVVDGFIPSSENSHFIMITDATASQIGNKTSHLHTGTLTIQVVTRQEGGQGKRAADLIADQILDLLIGDPTDRPLGEDNDHGYTPLTLAQAAYQQEVDEQYFIITKILNFNFSIYQK